ncbi:hypothetical protein CFK37_10765 [Virgibacillus phasianinus]|uniref:VanZ-like domain-containing protein n=1 Tax=Virgibacillus phasianinus TaxID=2017483 RepID=A0A220U379_9BACI|nr:VanZ family protein [Virgibacillus phasianinus]ASK62599.1 hypothetical protein CFK37_10765 [Virgibacillus phasianinus]
MSYLLLVLWIVGIFIGTCTNNVYDLFANGKIEFVFVPDPNWNNAFNFYPMAEVNAVESVGHFFMFFILAALLVLALQKIMWAGAIAVSFGILTEIVQVYFTRGADLYDLLADSLGVLTLLFICMLARWITPENYHKESQAS